MKALVGAFNKEKALAVLHDCETSRRFVYSSMIKWQLLDLTRVLLQPSPAQSASPPLGPQSMAVSAGHLVKTSVSPHSDLPPLTIRLLMQGKVGPRCSAVKLWPYPPYPYPYPSTPTKTTCILSSCEWTQHLLWHETQCLCHTPSSLPWCLSMLHVTILSVF